MNILFIHEVDWNRRVVYEIHNLSELLSLAGNNVYAISYESLWKKRSLLDFGSLDTKISYPKRVYEESSVQLREPGFIKIPGISRISSFVTQYKEIEKTIKKYKIGIIILYSVPTNGLQTLHLAKKYNIPVIFRSIDILHNLVKNPILSKITYKLENKVYSEVNLVLTISPKLSEYVSNMKAKNIIYYPLGVETSQFCEMPDMEYLRKIWGINKNDKVILFVGTLYNFSGLDIFIEHFSKVLAEVSNAKLLIVGDGEQRLELENLVKELDLYDKVIFTGYQNHELIPQFINIADICINPFIECDITRDIMPTKVLQYMACGKVVISTRLPGISSVIFGKEQGIIYANNNNELNENIIYYLNNKPLAVSIGNFGLEYILHEHSYSKLIVRLQEILNEYSFIKS